MQKRYPNQLSYGANNLVVALSETEVAKVFRGDTRSDIGSEAEKLKIANQVNGLVARFIRLDYDESNEWDMLVMERLYPQDFRSIEISKRELLLDVFEDELKELHQAGFVHRDIRRPSNQRGEKYDNILLTGKGLRLIDVGISALKTQVGEKLFFFKTGYQSQFEIWEIYKTYLRKDFLEILWNGKSIGVKNEIYNDFLAHLERIEDAVVQYKTKPLDNWIHTDWIGFYMDLYKELDKSKRANWNYVANPTGGFYGFWWDFIDTGKNYTAYLQLEQKKLCLKIEVPLDGNRGAIREDAYNHLLITTKDSGMSFVRPQRMGSGRYMTVLLFDGDYRIHQDGIIDTKKTFERLSKASQILNDTFILKSIPNQTLTGNS